MSAKIIQELKSLKANLVPAKKPVKTQAAPIGKSILSEAVKNKCTRQNKYVIVDWIQRTYDKKTADEVSQQIGLNEAKQQRKKVRAEKDRSSDQEQSEGEAPTKKVKTDKPEKNDAAETKPEKKTPVKAGQPSA